MVIMSKQLSAIEILQLRTIVEIKNTVKLFHSNVIQSWITFNTGIKGNKLIFSKKESNLLSVDLVANLVFRALKSLHV